MTEGLLSRLEGEFLLDRLLKAYTDSGSAGEEDSELWAEVDAFNNNPAGFDFEGYSTRALQAQKDWMEERVKLAMGGNEAN